MTDRARLRPDFLPVPEALDRILAAVGPLSTERVPLLDAVGRTLAEAIRSPIDQPPWDNSAMDGFAVRAADVEGVSEARPASLRVVDDVPAGAFPTRPIGPGEATRIMTGAPVPEGADSVVRIEHTDQWQQRETAGGVVGRTIQVFSDNDAGRNIRGRGEDLRRGEEVLRAGLALRAPEIGVLATVGCGDVPVHRRPKVAILSTGDELVDLDRYTEVLAGRRIVNSNSYALAAAVMATGCDPVLLGIARDDEASLLDRIEAARGADVLITTAGASVGEHDLVKEVLDQLGFSLAFWRVRMRPGSPFSFGSLDGMPVFGLPGNPVSALVTFHLLVRPALRRMAGRERVHNPVMQVTAGEAIPGAGHLAHFPRARLSPDGDGGWLAHLTGPQGSGILTSVAEADALLVVPENVASIRAGARLAALPIGGLDPAAAYLGFSTET